MLAAMDASGGQACASPPIRLAKRASMRASIATPIARRRLLSMDCRLSNTLHALATIMQHDRKLHNGFDSHQSRRGESDDASEHSQSERIARSIRSAPFRWRLSVFLFFCSNQPDHAEASLESQIILLGRGRDRDRHQISRRRFGSPFVDRLRAFSGLLSLIASPEVIDGANDAATLSLTSGGTANVGSLSVA